MNDCHGDSTERYVVTFYEDGRVTFEVVSEDYKREDPRWHSHTDSTIFIGPDQHQVSSKSESRIVLIDSSNCTINLNKLCIGKR